MSSIDMHLMKDFFLGLFTALIGVLLISWEAAPICGWLLILMGGFEVFGVMREV